MQDLKKVSRDIAQNGLYNTLLFEIEERLGDDEPTLFMIEELLKREEYFLSEYKEINRQGEISSIHVRELDIQSGDALHVKELKSRINQNTRLLRNFENFEADSKNSAYAIWIGSFGVMTLFMVHNVIALFSELYTTHAYTVYGSFALLMALTYIWYAKMKRLHDEKHEVFAKTYEATCKMIDEGLKGGSLRYDEVYG